MRLWLAILLLLFAASAQAQQSQGIQNAVVVSSCGSGALGAGSLTNLTMNPQGQLCLVGIGGGPSPPANTAAPVASGLLPVGSTLSCTTGTWTNSPTSFAYNWLRGGSLISGATVATYVTVTADGGTSVGCAVQATNAGGSSAFVNSNTLAIAAAGCTAATNYLARTTGGNEGGNAANITTFICGLVTDGVITGNLSGATGGCGTFFDALYVLSQQNQADALRNLCGTTYSLAAVGSMPTFTSYRGFGSFSTGAYLTTNFNTSTATSPKFTQNSASLGIWSTGITPEVAAEIGNSANGSVGESHLYNDYTGGLFYARINSASVGSVPTTGTVSSLFVGDRPSSASVIPYINGVAQATQSATSAAPLNGNITIGFVSTAASTQQFAAALIGASLGGTLELAFYNRLRTYLTAVGVGLFDLPRPNERGKP